MTKVQTQFLFSDRAERCAEQPINFLMSMALSRPNLISLAAGFVDNPSLPSPEVIELAKTALDQGANRVPLQYGTANGLPALRQTLLDHMMKLDGIRAEDINVTADDVMVTNGSQQLLFILTDILVNPGDIVITCWPSYFVYTGLLQSMGAQVRGVEMDDNGMIPEALDATLAKLAAEGNLSKVKIVYVVSYHQNPTGLTLSAARRPKILDIVKKYSTDHRILLLEDAAYRELTFRGETPPSIKKYDTDNEFVALAQTFSKPFAPGVKTGYGLLPRDLIAPAVAQKGSHDFGTSHLNQHVLLAAMKSGMYDNHLIDLRVRYRDKCQATLEALQEHLGDYYPGQTRWTRPNGGMYVYLYLPEHIDTGRHGPLFTRAMDEGMLYVPGQYCFGPDPTRRAPTNQIRLSYGVPSIPQIKEGVARLAKAIKAIKA